MNVNINNEGEMHIKSLICINIYLTCMHGPRYNTHVLIIIKSRLWQFARRISLRNVCILSEHKSSQKLNT